jgi:hypothetical protein
MAAQLTSAMTTTVYHPLGSPSLCFPQLSSAVTTIVDYSRPGLLLLAYEGRERTQRPRRRQTSCCAATCCSCLPPEAGTTSRGSVIVYSCFSRCKSTSCLQAQSHGTNELLRRNLSLMSATGSGHHRTGSEPYPSGHHPSKHQRLVDGVPALGHRRTGSSGNLPGMGHKPQKVLLAREVLGLHQVCMPLVYHIYKVRTIYDVLHTSLCWAVTAPGAARTYLAWATSRRRCCLPARC